MSDLPPTLPDGPWLVQDADDRRLVRNVTAADQPEPRAAGRYHLVVVGGGSAGLVTAASAAGLGARVALVEKTGLGGDCLLTGCVPSKALLAAAKRVHAVRTAPAFGVTVEGTVTVDFAAVMRRMRRVRADLSPIDSVERFTGLGVDVFTGHGTFTGPDRLEVGYQTLHFRSAVVATGGRTVLPSIPGLADANVHTHHSVFNLTALPPSMVVVGAGPVGCELAQAFARFGTRVHLVDRAPRVLPAMASDAAEELERALRSDGVQLHFGTTVERVDRDCAHLSSGVSVPAHTILVATGRAPVIDGLGLDRAGVDADPIRGIHVDHQLRTTNPRIWAAGDCAMPHRFTHVADATARIVVQNALFPKRRSTTDLVIPACVYTHPEVGEVGASIASLVDENVPHDVIQVDFAHVDRARLDGAARGFARVMVRAGTDRILGATVVGTGAGDLIGVLSMAITHGIGLGQFSSTVFPYPTRTEILRKLGDAWRRRRLSPAAQKALGVWFRLHS